MRSVLLVTAHVDRDRTTACDDLRTLDLVVVSDPDEPMQCEGCPQGERVDVYTTDEDGVALCLPHTFDGAGGIVFSHVTPR